MAEIQPHDGFITQWVFIFLPLQPSRILSMDSHPALGFFPFTTNHTNLNGSTRWGSPFRPPPWAQSLILTVHGLQLGLIEKYISYHISKIKNVRNTKSCLLNQNASKVNDEGWRQDLHAGGGKECSQDLIGRQQTDHGCRHRDRISPDRMCWSSTCERMGHSCTQNV